MPDMFVVNCMAAEWLFFDGIHWIFTGLMRIYLKVVDKCEREWVSGS